MYTYARCSEVRFDVLSRASQVNVIAANNVIPNWSLDATAQPSGFTMNSLHNEY